MRTYTNRIRTLPGLLLACLLIACTQPGAALPTATTTPLIAATTLPLQFGNAAPTAIVPTAASTLTISIASGDKALMNGDYTLARHEYRQAYHASGAPLTRAAALWGLGRVEYEQGNPAQTLAILRELLYYYNDSQQAPGACFLMAETLASIGRQPEAVSYYECYLTKKPGTLDAHIQERLGDALSASGNDPLALQAYQAALAAPHLGDAYPLQLKIAKTMGVAGDPVTAQALFEAILTQSDNFYILAQADLLAGQLHLARNEPDQAYAHFLHAVDQYPQAYDSYSALVLLVQAGVPVDEFQRGLVDYYAGEYGYALDAFSRFLASTPQHDGSVHYYRALAFREQTDFEAAMAEWNTFINNYSENPLWLDAWEDKAYTQWAYLGEYRLSAQTLLDFVQIVPGSANAPYELFVAGRTLERAGYLEEAAVTWGRIASEYPTSTLVPQALHFAGITRYRQYDWNAALFTFKRGLPLAVTPEDQSRANFWIGKTEQALGNTVNAEAAFQQAVNIDPTGFYSERARDMLFGREFFEPAAAYSLNVDMLAEQQEAEAWVRLTFNLPPGTDLSLIGALGADPRLVRGTEFWRLGQYDEARLEFEDLRLAISLDPADTFRLANYLLDLGLYRVAITATRQVLTLAGMETNAETLTAPAYFKHVRYGTYYLDLVLPAAQENGLDPLFLLAVMRQESLFEGFVRSSAGARGLMQIMPATGQLIVDDYGWPAEYEADDLYSPLVSIRLGAHHLMTNRLYFNGDLGAALAAYNAGVGSAIIWDPLSNDDPDLLVEVIRYEETRNYLRGIYENFTVYRSIYSTLP